MTAKSPQAPQESFDAPVLENVIGRDERRPVQDTTQAPWRAIARLDILYQNGDRNFGTAWFIGDRALATAAHNIHHKVKGRATEIRVSPAFDGRRAPFDSQLVEDRWCDPRWLAGNYDAALDYGVLVLEDPALGRSMGRFGVAVYDDARLKRLDLKISGYETKLDPPTQYSNGGRLERLDSSFLYYAFDTDNGMSGAPVFAESGGQWTAVGIHTGGNNQINRARRIDSAVYGIFDEYSRI